MNIQQKQKKLSARHRKTSVYEHGCAKNGALVQGGTLMEICHCKFRKSQMFANMYGENTCYGDVILTDN